MPSGRLDQELSGNPLLVVFLLKLPEQNTTDGVTWPTDIYFLTILEAGTPR